MKVTSRASLHLLLLLAVLAAASCQRRVRATAADAEEVHEAVWCYGEGHGPSQWGDLSPDYALAKLGGSQSPIDIIPAEAVTAELPPLRLDYQVQVLELVNNGHTVQADVDPHHFLYLGDTRYELLQFHFHAPSEHLYDGKPAAFEFHFVHRSEDGHLAVMAILGELGDTTGPQLVSFLDHAPTKEGGTATIDHVKYDPVTFFPPGLAYYAYDGSLTTPPATEGVRWFVLRDTVSIAPHDLERLRALYSGNRRPPQPLNARWILQSGN